MKNTYYRMEFEEVNGHSFSKRVYFNTEAEPVVSLYNGFVSKTESNLSDEEVLKANLQEEDNLTMKMENYFIPQMARDIS